MTEDLRSAYATAAAAGGPSVVLEGLHAVKHALRFGEVPTCLVTTDVDEVLALATELAPDVVEVLRAGLEAVPAEQFAALTARPPASPVLGIGRRRPADPDAVLAVGPDPVVLLEGPRHAGNVGAVVRVAAAAGAAGVLTTGPLDPWSASVLRGAAGLHYALPVGRLGDPDDPRAAGSGLVTARPVVALDPDGDEFDGTLPPGPVLVFGTERHGLSPAALDRAERRVRLPMRDGVSSLNLATSVAAVLYGLRLTQPDRAG